MLEYGSKVVQVNTQYSDVTLELRYYSVKELK